MRHKTIHLTGYVVKDLLTQGRKTVIYRGTRLSDKKPVIIKIPSENVVSLISTNRFRNEYNIGCQFDSAFIVKYYSIEPYHNGLALITEDFGGIRLSDAILDDGLKISEFLDIAIQIAEGLNIIHGKNVIYKDLKPGNIAICAKNKTIKFLDFGISTQSELEASSNIDIEILEGTLDYISPEQTGRTNRLIDYRCDLYSLGVTYYQLLCGKPPFQSRDPLELIHSHIARAPLPPSSVRPEIPPVISNIVMRLLEKNAEDRYQSVAGVKTDLEKCRNELLTRNCIETFEVGKSDFSDKFQISQKLYGREREIQQLATAFKRASVGKSEMILVAGYSGVGKSSVVNELQKPVLDNRGFFISAKFDPLNRGTAYSAISQAFQRLIYHILGEPEARIQEWKEQLLSNLGANGQIVIDVIPAVELIIGKQLAVQDLGPVESQNRFDLVFSRFVRTFAREDHPLVLFLDDLQNADLASLKLFKLLAVDRDIHYFMLIGSFRDNEVDTSHPVQITINEIETLRGNVEKIFLSPLDMASTSQLVSDALKSATDASRPLAEEIYQKTGGNAFFVKLFLQSIYTDRLLTFAPTKGWQWNLKEIKKMQATNNVADLMLRRLSGLPDETRKFLKLAACFGNVFPLEIITLIDGRPYEQILKDIQPALNIGIIVQGGDSFQFIHDKVQETAYSLIPDEEKQASHLRIGNILFELTSKEDAPHTGHSAVNHLNAAKRLILKESMRINVARLNLQEGRQLMKSAAYITALPYFIAGIEYLPEKSWEKYFDLAYSLHKGRAEAEYLNGNLAASQECINLLLQKSRTVMEKAELYSMLIYQYTVTGAYKKGIDTGRVVLKALGVKLPEKNLDKALKAEIKRATTSLGNRSVGALINSPGMKSHDHRAAMRILMEMQPTAYMFSPELYNVIAVIMANISMQHGHARESAKAYVTYANILSSVMQEYKLGFEFCQLGLRMSENLKDSVLMCRGNFIYSAFLVHWTRHFKEGEAALRNGYLRGIECGDFQYAGYTVGFGAANLFNKGMLLDRLSLTLRGYMDFVKKTKHQMPIDTIQGFQMAIANLKGETPDRLSFDTGEMTEKQFIEDCRKRTVTAYCYFMTLKAQTFYLYGKYGDALTCIHETEKVIAYIRGTSSFAECNFYHSLILAALYPSKNARTQAAYLAQIKKNQKQMKVWTDNCADNFLHKYLMVEAEKARITGKDMVAIKSYDLAIMSAVKNEFIHMEALANELAARFWLAFGKEDVAKTYLDNALQRYQRWGAKAKVAEIEENHSLLSSTAADLKAKKSPTSSSSTIGSLDFASIAKASRTISGEIVFEKLLEKTMEVVIENAGAQKGFLIMKEDNRLVISAEIDIESDKTFFLCSTPLEESQVLPRAIVHYVGRSMKSVVIDDAANDELFAQDAHVVAHKPRSIICMPIMKRGEMFAVLYLENNLTTGAFTPNRLQTLNLLAAQIAISIENARLYQSIENKVAERTRQLQEKTELLNNTNANLIETSKALESSNMELQSFAYVASHDLQEPLLKIIAFGDHLKKRIQNSDAQCVDYADRMQNSALRMRRLIEDLLKYSFVSTKARPFEPVDLNKTMKDVMEILEDRVQRTGGQVNIPRLPALEADPVHMQQLFQNLIGNALKYHRQNIPPIVNMECAKGYNGTWEISICDNGIGFDEKYCERIFKPFERLHGKSAYEGTGIGLAICKKIIDRHRGAVRVRSKVGEGSVFTVILPETQPNK